MRDRKNLALAEVARKRSILLVRQYFDENMEEPIGDLKAGLLLDWFVAQLGPAIYNQVPSPIFSSRGNSMTGTSWRR